MYQGQVVGTLLENANEGTKRAADVSLRVGRFLRHEKNFGVSKRLLENAVAIYTNILGEGHRDTLFGITGLSETYREEGQTAEAAQLQMKVVSSLKMNN